jgi:hypothetical protein
MNFISLSFAMLTTFISIQCSAGINNIPHEVVTVKDAPGFNNEESSAPCSKVRLEPINEDITKALFEIFKRGIWACGIGILNCKLVKLNEEDFAIKDAGRRIDSSIPLKEWQTFNDTLTELLIYSDEIIIKTFKDLLEKSKIQFDFENLNILFPVLENPEAAPDLLKSLHNIASEQRKRTTKISPYPYHIVRVK